MAERCGLVGEGERVGSLHSSARCLFGRELVSFPSTYIQLADFLRSPRAIYGVRIRPLLESFLPI